MTRFMTAATAGLIAWATSLQLWIWSHPVMRADIQASASMLVLSGPLKLYQLPDARALAGVEKDITNNTDHGIQLLDAGRPLYGLNPCQTAYFLSDGARWNITGWSSFPCQRTTPGS